MFNSIHKHLKIDKWQVSMIMVTTHHCVKLPKYNSIYNIRDLNQFFGKNTTHSKLFAIDF